MEEVFRKYSQEFEDLIDTTYLVWNGLPFNPTEKWQLLLARTILNSRGEGSCPFEKKDIRQQIALIWVLLIVNWRANKPKVQLRSYLLRMSRWYIRDWLLTHKPSIIDVDIHLYPILTCELIDSSHLPFALDLSFLVRGTDYFPLSSLSSYERYLLFLKFKEERNIIEIAHKVQCDPKTVRKKLRLMLNKLQKLSKETKNVRQAKPNGSCS